MSLKTFITVIVILLSTHLYAQTADGETPANEGICDSLVNSTPGLLGLCVAYCEAQDCDALESDSKGCGKILDNYNSKMELEVDPPMPCLQSDAAVCPCWTQREADLFMYGMGRFQFRWGPHSYSCRFHLKTDIVAGSIRHEIWTDYSDYENREIEFEVFFNENSARCGYYDTYWLIDIEESLPVSPESYDPLRACWETMFKAAEEFSPDWVMGCFTNEDP